MSKKSLWVRFHLQDDLDELEAVMHGAIGLLNAAILLAIVAVIVSNRSNTASMIERAFQFAAWLVKQIVEPVGTGYNVPLTSTLAPAFAGSGPGGSADGTAAGGGSGTGGAGGAEGASGALPGGWSASYVPGWTYAAYTAPDGSQQYGYKPPDTSAFITGGGQ